MRERCGRSADWVVADVANSATATNVTVVLGRKRNGWQALVRVRMCGPPLLLRPSGRHDRAALVRDAVVFRRGAANMVDDRRDANFESRRRTDGARRGRRQ